MGRTPSHFLRHRVRLVPFLVTVLVLVPVLLVSDVTALKVGPAAQLFYYEPGNTTSYQLRVINDDKAPVQVSITADGALASSLVIEPSSFELAPGERAVTVTVTNPQQLAPGRNEAKLSVTASAPGGQFSGGISLVHTLILYRAYEGAFLEATFRVSDAPPNGSNTFTLSLANRGKEAASVRSRVQVPGQAAFSLGSTVIQGETEGKLERSQTFDPPLPPGRYEAEAALNYTDRVRGQVQEAAKTSFKVGKPVVTFAKPATEIAPGIRKIVFPATLAWNEPVHGYLDVSLWESAGGRIAATRGPTAAIPPGASELVAYLEVPVQNPAQGGAEPLQYTLVAETRDFSGALLGKGQWIVNGTAPAIPVLNRIVSSLPVFVPAVVLVILAALAFSLWWRRRRAY
jgi:hypothetical protein